MLRTSSRGQKAASADAVAGKELSVAPDSDISPWQPDTSGRSFKDSNRSAHGKRAKLSTSIGPSGRGSARMHIFGNVSRSSRSRASKINFSHRRDVESMEDTAGAAKLVHNLGETVTSVVISEDMEMFCACATNKKAIVLQVRARRSTCTRASPALPPSPWSLLRASRRRLTLLCLLLRARGMHGPRDHMHRSLPLTLTLVASLMGFPSLSPPLHPPFLHRCRMAGRLPSLRRRAV